MNKATKTTTMAKLATRGLDVTRAGGLVLVDDGQTRWLAEESEYDAAVAALGEVAVSTEEMDAAERQDAEAQAYAELCDRVGGVVATNGGTSQGTAEELEAMVRRAVEAGLLTEDDSLVERYAA